MSDYINIKEIQKSLSRDKTVREVQKPGAEKKVWDFLNKDIKLFGETLPDKVKESFYLEAGALLSAGVDVRTALELVSQEQTKKKHKKIFENILASVVGGISLSAALKNNREFTMHEYYSVQIGEETGKLSYILQELAVFFQKKIKQRQQIISALTYPVLVIAVAFFAVSFMVTYVVPMFADVFKRFGGELPLVTRGVLYAASLVNRFFGLFLLFIAGAVFFFYANRKKDWFRNIISKIVLRIPVIGKIVQKIYLARFSNTMALLISSRIPIIQGIMMVKQMIGYYPVEVALAEAEQKIMSGSSVHKSLEAHSIFPKKMISLLKAGEEVNKLDVFFNKISEQYSADVEYQTNLLSKFLEPLIIIILGLVVGVILIAMYLPLFKMGQTF